jgi:hypothetical protein
MTITLNLKTVILLVAMLTILAILGNAAMDAYRDLTEIAHLYSS